MARVGKPVAERLEPLAPGFGDRVRAAGRMLGDFQQAAETMGVVYDQLRRIMNEQSVPSFPAIFALASKAGVSLDWLATGRGRMLADASLPTGTSNTAAAGNDPALPENSDAIYLRSYVVQGGNKALSSVAFSRRYLEHLQLSPEDVALLEQTGDAMAPTIGNGALMMLNLRRREISDGAIVAVRVGGELMVKRVQREPDGAVQLLSDNKSYGAIKMLPEAVRLLDVLGRVVWIGSAL